MNRVFSSSRQRGFATKSVVITSLRQSTTSMSLCCNWSLWSFWVFFLFCLQVVCPLPLLGCLHGGGWWDFLWIQRWCYRYNQHERGGPAPDCCVRKLRQVWISLKLTVFTSGCVQREVFVLCFCFIIHIFQKKQNKTHLHFLFIFNICVNIPSYKDDDPLFRYRFWLYLQYISTSPKVSSETKAKMKECKNSL